jgi:hypothetical protein
MFQMVKQRAFSVKVKNSQQYHSQTDDKGYFEILVAERELYIRNN